MGAVFGASPPRVDTQAQATAQNWKSIQAASEKLQQLKEIGGRLNRVGDTIEMSVLTHQGSRDSQRINRTLLEST